ncbi:hypothetical protein [Corallococcus silvisoli]|uniref:hypothetical protein n=1 Tax=Corallococcus silvisoli TaxID=2697031 RepID=UPI001376F3A2|nr:hypothetical protein [Corallococcus silvisoli]NBD10071.1 hypothetical protein [Corallococcus silvisoli]
MPLHFRFPLSALTRPVVLSSAALEDLGLDAPDPALSPEPSVLDTLVVMPQVLAKTLGDPEVFGPFPEPWERAGTYLPRLTSVWGESPGVPELLVALGGQQVAGFSFQWNTDPFRYSAWVDQLIHGYGDLDLLGFLLAKASRSDMDRHFERIPAPARQFALEAGARCLAPVEGRALAAALSAAEADGYAKLQSLLRGDESRRYATFLAPAPEEGLIDLLIGSTPRYSASGHPEQRGKPLRVERKTVLGVKRQAWLAAGFLIAVAATLVGCGLLIGRVSALFGR